VFQLVHTATTQFPLTTDFSAFYAGTTAMVLALVAGLGITSYRISLVARRAAVAEDGVRS
jgi:hypothetical protein